MYAIYDYIGVVLGGQCRHIGQSHAVSGIGAAQLLYRFGLVDCPSSMGPWATPGTAEFGRFEAGVHLRGFGADRVVDSDHEMGAARRGGKRSERSETMS